MVSYQKLSKKAKKAENARKRTLWTVQPTTKVVPAKKGGPYNRAKQKSKGYEI